MASERPDQTIHDAIDAHTEKAHLSGNVVDAYEKALSYAPEEIHDYLAPGLHALGYSTDDYISIRSNNYEARVEPGVKVLVTYGSGGGRSYAIGTVESAADPATVTIGDHTVTVKQWQIDGVFK